MKNDVPFVPPVVLLYSLFFINGTMGNHEPGYGDCR